MSKQPEALRLEDALETEKLSIKFTDPAAAELRRLHFANAAFESALRALRVAVKSKGVISTVAALSSADKAIEKHGVKS